MKKEEKIGKLLKEKSVSIAIAESCTGGLISDRMTDVPGASKYFKGSIISYSIEAKIKLLSVSEKLIKEKGVVSNEVAEQMAEGVRKKMNADIGLSITGIAGPEGGTEEKPVGTVYVSIATEKERTTKRFNFEGQRRDIKERAAEAAFDFLLSFLEGGNESFHCIRD